MTKAKTEAQKRRDKKACRNLQDSGMPELAPIKSRMARGAVRMAELAADMDALEARARHSGNPLPAIIDGMSKAQRRAVREDRDARIRDLRAPWHGCHAGRAMASIVTTERDRLALWDAIQHMRRVYAAYGASISAPKRHAQCLAILAPSDPLAATAETPPIDTRTDEERVRAARAAFRVLQSWLAVPDIRAKAEAVRVVVDEEPSRDARAMVRALHCVADGMAGRRISGRTA